MIKEITPEELSARISSGNAPKILDVREPHELDIAAIQHDAFIPLGQLPNRINELDSSQEWVVICRSGGRSGKATELLQENGFTVSNMVGGLLRWSDDVDTSMQKY